MIYGGVYRGGAQSRIPLFSPAFWNSNPAYQNKHISNPSYPIAFPNLHILHTKKFKDKILHSKKIKHKSCFNVFYLGEVYLGEEKMEVSTHFQPKAVSF